MSCYAGSLATNIYNWQLKEILKCNLPSRGGGGGVEEGGKGDRTAAKVHNDFMKLVNDVCHIEPIMDSFDRYGGHE